MTISHKKHTGLVLNIRRVSFRVREKASVINTTVSWTPVLGCFKKKKSWNQTKTCHFNRIGNDDAKPAEKNPVSTRLSLSISTCLSASVCHFLCVLCVSLFMSLSAFWCPCVCLSLSLSLSVSVFIGYLLLPSSLTHSCTHTDTDSITGDLADSHSL